LPIFNFNTKRLAFSARLPVFLREIAEELKRTTC